MNDIASSEVEELMMAFEAMTTVINFANVTMGSGDVDVAQQNYFDAKVLFTKLGNDRGVRAYSTSCTFLRYFSTLQSNCAAKDEILTMS